jgi:hypothetical protein
MAFDVKYGEVQVENDSSRNPLNGTTENVVVFRAQDKLLFPLLAHYRFLVDSIEDESVRPPQGFIDGIDGLMEAVLAWQKANPDKVKIPD